MKNWEILLKLSEVAIPQSTFEYIYIFWRIVNITENEVWFLEILYH